VGTNSGSSLGQIVLKSSTSTNDGIRFGETMALYQGGDGYLNTLGGLTIGSGLKVGYIYCPLLINGLNLDMKFALRTDNTKRFLWTDYSFATNYMSLTNNGGVGQLAVANLVATNLISGNGYGITNIPAANVVGLVSGNTYTFVNTNLAAGTVVTNGGIVLIGTNALTGGGIQLGDSYTNLSGFAVISYPSATTLVVNAMAQGVVDMTLATNIVIQAPTNAVNGRSLEYWILASGADRTVTFPTNNFRIPSSSSMTNVLIVTNGTMSQFGIRYDMQRNRWIMKSYVWGY